MFKNSSHCYTFKKIKYNKGLLDNAVDATYIIHLEGNGRYNDIMNQLESYHPTKEVYIIFNKGYKKCSKDDRITLPAHDLTDAFLQVFKHAKNQNYNNILILEDDFMFNAKIKKESIRNDICTFLNNNKNEDCQYFLGCIPSLRFPYTIDLKHFINILSMGTHAVIYTKKNRETLLNVNQENIIDWDYNSFTHSRRYMYCEPLCYQLCPDTENSENWGTTSYFLYILAQVVKKILKIFKLDTQVEPGYSFFYTFSTLFTFILLILILVIVYKISITLFKRKIKVSKKK